MVRISSYSQADLYISGPAEEVKEVSWTGLASASASSSSSAHLDELCGNEKRNSASIATAIAGPEQFTEAAVAVAARVT